MDEKDGGNGMGGEGIVGCGPSADDGRDEFDQDRDESGNVEDEEIFGEDAQFNGRYHHCQ